MALFAGREGDHLGAGFPIHVQHHLVGAAVVNMHLVGGDPSSGVAISGDGSHIQRPAVPGAHHAHRVVAIGSWHGLWQHSCVRTRPTKGSSYGRGDAATFMFSRPSQNPAMMWRRLSGYVWKNLIRLGENPQPLTRLGTANNAAVLSPQFCPLQSRNQLAVVVPPVRH